MMSTDRGLLPQQKENAQHGEHGFPVQRYRTNLHATYQDVPTHWHEEAELTLILRGSSTYTVQLEREQVHEGDIIFVPPQVLHAVTTGGGEMDSDTFVFHMNLLGAGGADVCTLRYLAPLSTQKMIPPTVIRKEHPIHGKLLGLIREMNRTWEERGPGWELLIKAQLLTAIAWLIPYCTTDSAEMALRTEHAGKIKIALDFMENNYGDEIAIADVAAACYFSQYHFMRFFKKYMGMSCGEYLKNLRLEKAAQAFARGCTGILDVAMDSGFRNLSYFYREFQKKYGVTPKQFIHRCAEMPKE